MWKKGTYICFPIVGVVTFWVAGVHFSHEHKEDPYPRDKPMPGYRQRRQKPFPWGACDCDMLDMKCWERARAAAAEK